VLVNLVVNAIQAIEFGGKIEIKTYSKDKSVYLVVSDTGKGMSEEVRKKIFLPFFSTKDVGEGTGLGLSVVHGIVSSHKGDISVASEEGKGASFSIRMPME
jgi:signal transduction histidine kinase